VPLHENRLLSLPSSPYSPAPSLPPPPGCCDRSLPCSSIKSTRSPESCRGNFVVFRFPSSPSFHSFFYREHPLEERFPHLQTSPVVPITLSEMLVPGQQFSRSSHCPFFPFFFYYPLRPFVSLSVFLRDHPKRLLKSDGFHSLAFFSFRRP